MFTSTDKNLLIASLERAIQDAKEAAGVATMAEVETAVTALRTAYDTDPATVTAAQIVAASEKVVNFSIPTLTTLTAVLNEAKTEAVI